MRTASQLKTLQKSIASHRADLPKIFNALGDERRYRIFCLLLESHDLCVSELASIFRISIPAVSQQLKLLESAGLVQNDRMGQMSCYKVSIDDPVVKAVIALCVPAKKKP